MYNLQTIAHLARINIVCCDIAGVKNRILSYYDNSIGRGVKDGDNSILNLTETENSRTAAQYPISMVIADED